MDMTIQNMPVTSLLTVLLQRMAAHGLRQLPEIIQREAQKALTTSSF